MQTTMMPISVVSAVPFENGIRFLHRDSQIDIGEENAKEVWSILQYCNGYNDISAIANLTKIPIDVVSKIISELQDLEILVDSREQFIHFHRISNYPTSFSYNLSQEEIRVLSESPRMKTKEGKIISFEKDADTALNSIIGNRRSCRNFSEEKLSLFQIGNICHFAYSIHDHVVPSGGALYPLKIYVLIEHNQVDLAPGYYEYDSEADNLVLFNDEIDVEALKHCFNQEELPFGSSVQIVIAADFRRQSRKYANRGYRLALVEAGHVAENISLYCAENGIGACEMGGVQDEALMFELDILDNDICPILAIAIGYESDSKEDGINKVDFTERLMKKNCVKEYWTQTFGPSSTIFGTTVSYKDCYSKTQYAGATSVSYVDSVFKAVIEGYERWRSSQVRSDYFGPANHLQNWLHPRYIAPLTCEQSERLNVKPFTDDLPISWTKGTRYNGEGIFVPSDIVYYGQKDDENRIYFGHSSGIAAFTNKPEAEKRALVELIERDALMRNWYSRKSPNIINPTSLPIHAKKRMEYWDKHGRKMYVLEMPSDYGRVVEVLFVSDEYPCIISGAAATIDDKTTSETINKALQEAEFNLLLHMKFPDSSEISPEKVSSPSDHGKLYHSPKYLNTLSWLWNGKVVDQFEPIPICDFDTLKSKLQIITVDMSEDDSELFVVRVFSPKLVPINFGFNSAHFTHPELSGKISKKSLSMPHYFA